MSAKHDLRQYPPCNEGLLLVTIVKDGVGTEFRLLMPPTIGNSILWPIDRKHYAIRSVEQTGKTSYLVHI